jgi:hypothetical protein
MPGLSASDPKLAFNCDNSEIKLSMTLDFVSRIVDARGGDLIVGVQSDIANSVENAAGKFGLVTSPDTYFEITSEEAKAVLRAVLAFDLAYHCELMPSPEADRLASEFVDSFEGKGATYYTNGEFGKPRKAPGVGPSWTPATNATFDTGVLVLARDCIACAWFMDED